MRARGMDRPGSLSVSVRLALVGERISAYDARTVPTPLPWKDPTLFAPMEGVTHPAIRNWMADRGGLGMVCTEFVRVTRAPLCPRVLAREVVPHPSIPLSVQVMGNEVDKMADAARVMAEAGADVVDLNLGCPMPRIVRKGVGAAMLRDPVLLEKVVRAMRAKTPCLLSAKIRAGWDDAAGVVETGRVLEGSGIDFLTVHPRRRSDFYSGVADWRIVRSLKRALSIPVIGNGDVWYARDALRLTAETGCDAVMIGRPALRNPWIFRQLRALREGVTPHHPSGEDVLAVYHELRALYDRTWRNPIGKIKELLRYLGRALRDDGGFLRGVLRAGDLDEIDRRVDGAFLGLPPEALDLDAEGARPLERSASAALAEAAA